MNFFLKRSIYSTTGFLVAFLLSHSISQTCTMPTSNQWNYREIIGDAEDLNNPTNMSLLPDGRILFSEMWSGRVMMYTPGSGLSVAIDLDVYIDNGRRVENGLLGVMADLDFENNNWVYAFYSRTIPGNNFDVEGDRNLSPHEQVVVRFTMNNSGQLINEKDLFVVNRGTARHAAGGMEIDISTGYLFVSTGDDTHPFDGGGQNPTTYGPRYAPNYYWDALRSSSNTNDLRGKVLRIKPLPFPDNQNPAMGVGSTYEIPPGNLFPPEQFTDGKTRPEIYTMGHRNPYHIKFDTTTGWLMIGEVGPDAGADNPNRGLRGHDEFNLATGPGNFGWPFSIADSAYTAGPNEPYAEGTTFDLNNLQNLSTRNTGLVNLPAVTLPIAWYTADGNQYGANNDVFGGGGESALGGPLYWHDQYSSNVQLPGYFNGKYLVGEYARNKLFVFEMNNQAKIEKVELLRQSTGVLDLEMGPNGELYVLNYRNGTLFALEYTGPQYDPSICTHFVPAQRVVSVDNQVTQSFRVGPSVQLANLSFYKVPKGTQRAEVFNSKGEKIYSVNELADKKGFEPPGSSFGSGMIFLKYYSK